MQKLSETSLVHLVLLHIDCKSKLQKQSGLALPHTTFAKCENKICLAQKILIWRNQVAKKMKIGGEVLQVSKTIGTVIKSGYCILHLCQIG